jgi:hypothetical protein
MLRKSLLVFSILCVAILIGCSKTEMSNSNTADNSNKSTSSTGTTSTTGTTSSSGDKIGVAECDDFLAKYEACVTGKVPEVARAQYQNMLKQWKESWKKLADNPQTKGSLAATCKQIRDAQEAGLKSFGCTW